MEERSHKICKTNKIYTKNNETRKKRGYRNCQIPLLQYNEIKEVELKLDEFETSTWMYVEIKIREVNISNDDRKNMEKIIKIQHHESFYKPILCNQDWSSHVEEA